MASGVAVPRELPTQGIAWPDFGSDFALNRFYGRYDHAEGWFGESFLRFDTVAEAKKHTATVREFLTSPEIVFGGNGGGEYFGVRGSQAEEAEFIVIPSVGAEQDIFALGTWDDFLSALMKGKYLP
ncbi:MAG: hypothetical protein AAF919_14315 [Pseudomonadota bacterium]